MSLGGAAPLGDGGRGTWALYLVSSRHFLDGGVVGGVCSEQFCDGFFYIGGGDSCSWWHGVVFWSVLRLIGFCFLGPCACFPLVGFVFCVLFGVIWWGVRFVAGVTWDVGVVDVLWVACLVMIYVLT